MNAKLNDGGVVGAGWSAGDVGNRTDDAGLRFVTGAVRAFELPAGHGALRAGPAPDGYGALWVAFEDGSSWSSGSERWKLEVPRRDAGVVTLNSRHYPLCEGLSNGEVWCDERLRLTVAAQIVDLESSTTPAEAVCALLDGGALACAGNGPFVPLTDAGVPERVVDLCMGSDVSCVVTAAGRTHCSVTNDALTLDPARPLPGAWPGSRAVACDWRHVCVLSSGGGVQCWGLDLFAPNPAGAPRVVAQAIPLGGPAKRIATDGETACAVLTTSGEVKCWGSNAWGQRGAPRLISSPTPRPIRY